MSSAPKVVLLALDGWGFELVKKYINEHQLPCLENIATHGVFGVLPSVIPYVTLPAWPAMLTGKNPGKLGVYAFLERNSENYSLQTISLQWDKWNAIWKILGEHGKRSIIFNVPTVSAEFSNFPGIVVSGPIMDKQEGVYAYPSELNEKLVKDNYKIYASEYEKVSHEEFYKEIMTVTEKKFNYMLRLFENETWDFFMAGFYYGDVLQHRFWQYMDPVSDGYEQNPLYSKIIINYMQMVDQYIRTFLERRPENCTLLIVSDHGLGYSKAKFDINCWLYENKYMMLKQNQLHSINLPSIRKYSLYFIIQSLYKKLAFIPVIRWFRNWFWKNLPKGERSWRDVDWDATKAYGSWYSLFINLKGREPRGIVKPGEEYLTLREEIIKKMMDFRDPVTGEPVLKKIWRKEELYNGPYFNKLPDLVIEFSKDSLYWSTTAELAPGLKIIDYVTGYSGAHVRDGILMGFGNGIRKGFTVAGMSLLDVTPTILHLLDVPIPSNIDGRILKEIFTSESPEFKREVRFAEVKDSEEVIDGSIVEDEDQRLKDRLRGLGYLE